MTDEEAAKKKFRIGSVYKFEPELDIGEEIFKVLEYTDNSTKYAKDNGLPSRSGNEFGIVYEHLAGSRTTELYSFTKKKGIFIINSPKYDRSIPCDEWQVKEDIKTTIGE